MDTRTLSTDVARPAPIAQGERELSLDALRGLALLGILAMNVMTFAMPLAAYSNPTVLFAYEGRNKWAYAVIHTIFDMKMMALFSMLFGAGVVVWSTKARTREDVPRVRALWLRRMFWLLVIGMVHAWLIWEGDILVSYAICGLLVLWWLRRLPPGWLLAAAGGFFLVHLLLVAAQGFFVTMLFSESDGTSGWMSAEELAEARKGMKAFTDPTPEQVQEQLSAMRGSWMEVFRKRAGETFWFQLQGIPFFLFWRSSAMMLVGAALTKWGVFTGRRSARFYAVMACVGYALGVALIVAGVAFNTRHGFEIVSFNTQGAWFNILGSVPMALGHAGLVLWVVRAGVARALVSCLAAVGQMAFTNYLSHSVICSLVFYGFGLGLAGRLDRFEQFAYVVVPIWMAQLLWSSWWLARFRFGPMEWLWRSLTYNRWQPFRRDVSPA